MIHEDSVINGCSSPLARGTSVIKVDCIVHKSSRYRRQEFARRQRITVGDFATWIVSTEDLILSKLVWARDSPSELQLRDVRNLITSECDAGYIERWTGELGVGDLWRECQP